MNMVSFVRVCPEMGGVVLSFYQRQSEMYAAHLQGSRPGFKRREAIDYAPSGRVFAIAYSTIPWSLLPENPRYHAGIRGSPRFEHEPRGQWLHLASSRRQPAPAQAQYDGPDHLCRRHLHLHGAGGHRSGRGHSHLPSVSGGLECSAEMDQVRL